MKARQGGEKRRKMRNERPGVCRITERPCAMQPVHATTSIQLWTPPVSRSPLQPAPAWSRSSCEQCAPACLPNYLQHAHTSHPSSISIPKQEPFPRLFASCISKMGPAATTGVAVAAGCPACVRICPNLGDSSPLASAVIGEMRSPGGKQKEEPCICREQMALGSIADLV